MSRSARGGGLQELLRQQHGRVLAVSDERTFEVVHGHRGVGHQEVQVARVALPVAAGVVVVGVAEGDVQVSLLVLQQVADEHPADPEVGSQGELAHAVTVLAALEVLPELFHELGVLTGDLRDAGVLDLHGDGVFDLAPLVTHAPVRHHGALNAQRRGEDLATRQVLHDAGLHQAGVLLPFPVRVELHLQVGAELRGHGAHLALLDDLGHAIREGGKLIHRGGHAHAQQVEAHARRVAVTQPQLLHAHDHGHPEAIELVALGVRSADEDARLGLAHGLADLVRELLQWPLTQILHLEELGTGTGLAQGDDQEVRHLLGRLVIDEGNLVTIPQAEVPDVPLSTQLF